ncbi:hypothetical protein PM082_012644 [Marasmius tenuissimus]|nr:hypothetical protein PM082_012644 [Marasmius tenuissimus]
MITNSAINSVVNLAIPDPCELPEFDVWTHLRNLQPVAVSVPSRLHAFLHEADFELSEYDHLIRVLESRLLEAQSKRDSLRSHASQLSSLLSPIRQLPSEILMKIFRFASTISMGGNKLGTNSQWKSQAFQISSVCYRWRIIALDTPELWAHFAVDLQLGAQEPLDLLLSRSRERKLSITITHINRHEAPNPSLLCSLIEHSFRWASLDYHYLEDEETLDLMDEIQELPSLEYIVCPARGIGTPVTFSEQLRQCASLKTLVVRYESHARVDISSLPLDSIKCIIFQYRPKKAFRSSLEVLKSCAHVIKRIVYQSVPKEKDREFIRQADYVSLDHVQEPIECKHVWKLTINLYHKNGIYHHLADVFQSLTLPSLVDLRLTGDCGTNLSFDGTWPAHFFDEFIVRSKCTLTALTIDLPLSDEELINSLHHFPSLKDLSIIELFKNEADTVLELDKLVKTVTKSLIKRLTVVDTKSLELSDEARPSPFLPKLDYLRLLVHAHFDADEEFVKMVQSRWYPFTSNSANSLAFSHCRLEWMILDIQDRGAEKSVYEPLKVCDSEGMKIVVKANGAYVV